MELLHAILQKAISLGASDIHIVKGQLPVYRIRRELVYDQSKLPVTEVAIEKIMEYLYSRFPHLQVSFEEDKQLDFTYSFSEHRFRVNISLTKSSPTFSIRVIPNGEIKVREMGLLEIIKKMKTIKNGLILVTGKVNSGKSTTMNGFIQEVNKTEKKKIVTLEDPIEYEHIPQESIVIQKAIGKDEDVLNYRSGLINLLREDVDIAVIGEIRDKETMEVALDLAESGGLVIGTLHTRSCGETVERIINLYDPADQMSIKNSLSNVLKMVVSQKLVLDKSSNLLMVPEVMMVNNVLAAQIRQEKFSVSDLEDSIHSSNDIGCISFEQSFTDLYIRNMIDFKTVKENIDVDRLETVKNLIISSGVTLE